MIAAFQTGRNSIGVEIDPDYCRMAARYLKAETTNLFSSAQLIFAKVSTERACMVKEDQALYEVKPARRKVK
jgi:site-specific DNA-methyltransferase (adenine-specific)